MRSLPLRVVAAGVGSLLVTVLLSAIAPASSMASSKRTDISAAAEDYFSQDCYQSWLSCQNGVKTSYPDLKPRGEADLCWLSHPQAKFCVKYYGDYVWIKDDFPDSRSMVGVIRRSDGGGYVRACRNRSGSGTWARCNFDWAEGGYHWTVEAWTFNAETDSWKLLTAQLAAFYD